ncbi:NTF2-related export protein 2-like [Sycon ciliatum]|uniref:NTF2-related export protein 2-like n=1 Tax=Sycon ciliatum TaxID=27933 RepID=UPI0031F655E9|eukprot:scpid27858/ scgid14860/ NTF2-related export protein 2
MAALESIIPVVEVASRAGEEFVQLYYESIDKRRHVMAPLYSDASQFLWNGWCGHGLAQVMQLLQRVPSSEHTLHTLDCQPVAAAACNGSTQVLVSTEGHVKYDGDGKTHCFSQQFVLLSEDGVWKILSDCFRFIG